MSVWLDVLHHFTAHSTAILPRDTSLEMLTPTLTEKVLKYHFLNQPCPNVCYIPIMLY